jgi:hypothetical protein
MVSGHGAGRRTGKGEYEERERIREAKRVLKRNLAGEDRSRISGEGTLLTLTFLEHPIDRKAEYCLLKGKNAGTQDPA